MLRLAVAAAIVCGIGCTGNVKPNAGATTSPTSPADPTPPLSQTFAISGTISPAASASTTVSLSGAATATTTAASNGAFSFSGLAAGTYAVTPSATGFGFNPTTQAAVITTTDITGLNFASAAQTAPTFTLSGTITPASLGNGSAVVLSGPVGATATANASGAFSFPGLINGAYSVTPGKSGVSFNPGSQSASVNGTNVTGVNFTATAATQQAHTVSLRWTASTSTVTGYNVFRSTAPNSGFVQLNTSLITALTYSDQTVSAGTTYFYVATAVDAADDQSSDSNQATAAIPN